MPSISCPFAGCDWQTADLDGTFAAILLQQMQMHEKDAHTKPSTSVKLKIDPPKIAVGANPEEWESFVRQWNMYKTGTLIPVQQESTALFYCCEEELRNDILRDFSGDLATMSEKDLLKEIKRLSVREESVLVQRMKLNRMTQAPGMSIRTFLAGLRGQASLCKFEAKCSKPDCTHTFNYSNEMIKDNLIRGLTDPEILADLLGDPKTDRTLDEVVSFVSQKEQGKLTRSAMGENAGAISHQNQSTSKKSTNMKSQFKCWACTGPSHGPRNDRETREKKCPAWSNTCNKCNIKGHYNKSCSKCTVCGSWGHRDNKSKFCKKKG